MGNVDDSFAASVPWEAKVRRVEAVVFAMARARTHLKMMQDFLLAFGVKQFVTQPPPEVVIQVYGEGDVGQIRIRVANLNTADCGWDTLLRPADGRPVLAVAGPPGRP